MQPYADMANRALVLVPEEAFHPARDLVAPRHIRQQRACDWDELIDRVKGCDMRPGVRLREAQPCLESSATVRTAGMKGVRWVIFPRVERARPEVDIECFCV